MILLVILGLTVVKIPYEVKKDCQKVEFYYSPDGKEWDVIGMHQYPYFSSPIQDTFRWVVKGKPKGGIRLKVVYFSPQGRIEKEVKDFKIKVKADKGEDYYYYGRTKGPDKSDTTYSWRMLGYDAQHTWHYPHPLYPPLELKWEYGEGDPDYTMVSSSAGNGMLYTRNGEGHDINWVSAIDIETGNEVWSRELTSNVWTTVLSPGDSLLFVGTSSGWDSLSPTFYCMDPFTGSIKWSKFFYTVEYSPIVVDTVVYASTLQGYLYAYTLEGAKIWIDHVYLATQTSWGGTPVYFRNKVYIGGENRALLSLDANTGETLWVYPTENWILNPPIIYNNKVFISCDFYDSNNVWTGGLYSLDTETGDIVWKREREQEHLSGMRFEVAGEGQIYAQRGYWVVVDSLGASYVESFDADSGDIIWTRDLYSGATDSPVWGMSGNGIIWITSQWIYAIDGKDGQIISVSDSFPDTMPGVDYIQYARFFPILYKNYLIRAHRYKIFLYQGRVTPLDTLNITSIDALPNPFVNTTTIIANTGANTLFIYDPMGRRIKGIKGSKDAFGYMHFLWDGKGENGISLPAGIYFCKVGSLRQKLIKIGR